MRASVILWLVSGAVSLVLHAGALEALSYIPLPVAKEALHTQLQLAGANLDSLFRGRIQSLLAPEMTATERSAKVLQSQLPSSERIASLSDETVSAMKPVTVTTVLRPSQGAEKLASTETAKPAATLETSPAPEIAVDTSSALKPTVGSETLPTQSGELAPLAPASRLEPAGIDTLAVPQQSQAQASVPVGAQLDAMAGERIAAADQGPVLPSTPSSQPAAAVKETSQALSAHKPLVFRPATKSPPEEIAAVPSVTLMAPEVPARQEAVLASKVQSSGRPAAAVRGESRVLSAQKPLESRSAAKSPPKEIAALPSTTLTAPEVSGRQEALPAPKTEPSVQPVIRQPAHPVRGKTQTAKTAAVVSPLLTQAERVRKFLENDGNRPCVYAKPGKIEEGRPSFTGYGGGWARIRRFSADFTRAVGVDPLLAIRPVMDTQCPTVDFVRSLGRLGAGELAIIIDHQQIADFGNLIGHLEGEFGTNILLLVIDDDGAVQDISPMLHRKGNANVFAEPVRLRAHGGSRYQMLLAICTHSPLVSGATMTPGEAQRVFKRLAAQITARNRITSWGIASFQVK